ncbi:MAG TPA: hypothetical protein VF657_06505 [Actinoplanes sp.]
MPELTEHGRFIVISGRRWRATDPVIPEDVAAALCREQTPEQHQERWKQSLGELGLGGPGLGELGH